MEKEQRSFNFEEGAPKPAADTPEGRHLEADDECQYCGNPFEGKGDCVHCKDNRKKRDYLENLAEKKKPA